MNYHICTYNKNKLKMCQMVTKNILIKWKIVSVKSTSLKNGVKFPFYTRKFHFKVTL